MADEIQGVNVEEPAAPQSTEVDTDVAGESTVENDGGSEPAEQNTEGQQKQSPDVNAIAAAARRESQAALKAERERFARTTALIKDYGVANEVYSDADVAAKFGSQGINTLEDLAAEVERQNAIQRGEPDPVALKKAAEEALKNNPIIKSFEEAQTKSQIEKTISDFKADFPDVQFDPKKGLEQFENAEGISGYLAKGLTLSESYSLANRKSIQSRSSAAGRQAALNDINSKGHIKPTGGSSDIDNTVVPPETMALYRQFNRHMTDEQIKKHYTKSLKEGF